MRVNLFVYRDLHDPWLKQFREAPQETLFALWPGLHRLIGNFKAPGPVHIRPVDLYVTKGYRQDGVVLVGDAYATSCPAAGTGARKVLVDVERLCNVHIPRWLATPGMGESKIAAYYDDPVKLACDALSARKAFTLRSYSIDPALKWAALRFAAKVRARTGRKGLRRRSERAVCTGSDEPIDDEADQQHAPTWGARQAGAQGGAVRAASLLLDAEPDHRPVIDTVGVFRRHTGHVQSGRAFEIVGVIAQRQFRRGVEPV